MTAACAGRICVVFNPSARGEKAIRFRKFLDGSSASCALKPTLSPGGGRLLAAQAVEEGFDTIVAAGGDGTINEVINGMGDVPGAFARARLAILPAGTVNVMAKELGIPARIERAWQVILAGREIAIDLPRVTLTGRSGATETRYFAQMAGAGLDARAVEKVSCQLKKRIGQFAYVVAAWQALRETHPPLQIETDAGTVTGELVIVGNGRFYGGKVPVFHQADYQDGLLDVCVFPKVTWFALCRYAFAYLAHRLLFRRAEQYFQTAALRITGPSDVPVELDGEAAGRVPLQCAIEHRMLRIVVP